MPFFPVFPIFWATRWSDWPQIGWVASNYKYLWLPVGDFWNFQFMPIYGGSKSKFWLFWPPMTKMAFTVNSVFAKRRKCIGNPILKKTSKFVSWIFDFFSRLTLFRAILRPKMAIFANLEKKRTKMGPKFG